MSFALIVLVCVVLGLSPAPVSGGPALTIYSQDLGFVRETRMLELAGARDTVRLPEVGERLDFSSVRLVPGGGARVARLAYRFDAASGDGLIDRARGSRVRVASRGDRVAEGTLVSADGSWLVIRADDGAISTHARAAIEEVRMAKPPGDMLLRPTLEVVVEGGKRGRVEAELSYLTGGVTWSAEHTLVRSGEGGALWSAVVTVDNSSGREFRDATLKLVAGEPRRDVAMPPRDMLRTTALGMAASEEKADLGEESFADYHLYSLDRPATLRDRESQSLSMIAPRTVKVTPRYLYRGGARGVASQIGRAHV